MSRLPNKFKRLDFFLGLVSFCGLCALNIYVGVSKNTSKLAYREFLKNLTNPALSEENDEIFLSFNQAISLAHSIVNTLIDITREENKSISEISEQINEKLDTNFEAVESSAMEIQLGVEPEQLDEPIQASTPLTEKEIRAFHDKEKTDYLKKTLKLNAVDLESAAEVADSENEKLFQEVINLILALRWMIKRMSMNNLVIETIQIKIILYLAH